MRDDELIEALERRAVVELFTKEQIGASIYKHFRDPKDPWVRLGEWLFPVLVLLGVAASIGMVFGLFWLIPRIFKSN